MSAHPVPETEKLWIDHKRLRLIALAAGVALRNVERRIGISNGHLWHFIARGWLRRDIAQRIASELGCKPSDFEARRVG